tara:strand:- start:1078 stop:1431 length:354 start_codon:yes stop_codon:yes gene_type:complete
MARSMIEDVYSREGDLVEVNFPADPDDYLSEPFTKVLIMMVVEVVVDGIRYCHASTGWTDCDLNKAKAQADRFAARVRAEGSVDLDLWFRPRWSYSLEERFAEEAARESMERASGVW